MIINMDITFYYHSSFEIGCRFLQDTETRLNCRVGNLFFTIFKDNLSLHQLFMHTQKSKFCPYRMEYGIQISKKALTFLVLVTSGLGWFKNAFSSETDKIMLGTTFSHYVGIKQCRKSKIENFYTFFHPVQALRSFTK